MTPSHLHGFRFDRESQDYKLRNQYVDAIKEVNGFPLLLPSVKDEGAVDDTLGIIDGVLLAEGADVDPSHFGEEPRYGMKRLDPERDVFELVLAKGVIKN